MDTRTRRRRHPHSLTLTELVEAYDRHIATLSLSKRTLESYREAAHQFADFMPPGTPVSDISELDVQRWIKHRRDAGLAAATVRGNLRRLRSGLFAWAHERKAFRHNWAKLAKMPPDEQKVQRSVDEETFARLLAITADSPTELRDRALLWILWDTGARIGSITNLRREDILLHRQEIRFVKTKTREERYNPIFEHCVAAISDYIAFERGNEDGPFWINSRTGEPLHEQTLKHVVMKLGKLAGVKVSAHDFRRGLVERLQARGMSDSLIMQITGHRSVDMVVRYGRRRAAENARAEYRRRMVEGS